MVMVLEKKGLSLKSGDQIFAEVGGELLDKFLSRRPEKGGNVGIITGEQGSGKTTLMLLLAKNLIGKDIVIWRGRFLAQWHRFPNWEEKVRILVHKDDNIEFLKLPYDGSPATKLEIPDLVTYESAEDVLRLAKKDKLNVVYEPPGYRISDELVKDVKERTGRTISPDKLEEEKPAYFWFELLYRLLVRRDRRWYSVFIDEVDDIFPETPKGAQFALQDWMKDIVKDLRKGWVSLIMSTHTLKNVDWRIRTKIPTRIYLRGAEVEQGSIVRKQVVLGLRDGYAVIDWGRFGGFFFKPLPPVDYDVLVNRK
ncbi:ATP-binding protein [Thermococcus sp. M39]|uniref:ATP-binding protein n=1 Tax=Thermococcus sp. M39 TaxID=1638262 RepID=UPI00143C6019|nr:ATP-binding protein [Thermococcus sp. M39]NJE08561.1 ATP-binding protein [Thermococcus sp. M39]